MSAPGYGLGRLVCPWVVVVLSVGLLPGCLNEEAASRCDEIEQILIARGEQLPLLCNLDTDCVIVEVRPGVAAVTSEGFDPGEVQYLIDEYEASCGAFDRQFASATATCQNSGANRRCVVDIEPYLSGLTPDAGPEPCDCAADLDCPSGSPVCLGCVCRDACGRVCYQVDQCGLLSELGFGQSLVDCTTRCRSLEDVSPLAADELQLCLANASCETISACGLIEPGTDGP